MSLAGENLEEKLDDISSETDNEENIESAEEGDSDESAPESLSKLKNICSVKKHKHLKSKKTYRKIHAGRLNVSIRQSKHGRWSTAKSKTGKYIKRKTNREYSVKNQENPEKLAVVQKGKRCRLGGKAKAMPPEEENCDKYDSDEEPDSFYFNRISLGCFQKYKDESGASTSYSREENYRGPNVLSSRAEGLTGKTSEELELMELQQWGMSSMVHRNKRTDKLNRDIRPDTF